MYPKKLVQFRCYYNNIIFYQPFRHIKTLEGRLLWLLFIIDICYDFHDILLYKILNKKCVTNVILRENIVSVKHAASR